MKASRNLFLSVFSLDNNPPFSVDLPRDFYSFQSIPSDPQGSETSRQAFREPSSCSFLQPLFRHTVPQARIQRTASCQRLFPAEVRSCQKSDHRTDDRAHSGCEAGYSRHRRGLRSETAVVVDRSAEASWIPVISFGIRHSHEQRRSCRSAPGNTRKECSCRRSCHRSFSQFAGLWGRCCGGDDGRRYDHYRTPCCLASYPSHETRVATADAGDRADRSG